VKFSLLISNGASEAATLNLLSENGEILQAKDWSKNCLRFEGCDIGAEIYFFVTEN